MKREDMVLRAKFTARCANPGCGWKTTRPASDYTTAKKMREHEQWHRDQERA